MVPVPQVNPGTLQYPDGVTPSFRTSVPARCAGCRHSQCPVLLVGVLDLQGDKGRDHGRRSELPGVWIDAHQPVLPQTWLGLGIRIIRLLSLQMRCLPRQVSSTPRLSHDNRCARQRSHFVG